MKHVLSALVAAAAVAAAAELLPVSPAEGGEIPVQTKECLAVTRHAKYSNRIAELKKHRSEYKKDKPKKWRTAAPAVFKWQATGDEHGPWKILISKTPDFKNAIEHWEQHAGKEKGPSGKQLRTLTVPYANLEVGRTYWWKICSGVKCREKTHGRKDALCGCNSKNPERFSKAVMFKTADTPPRWIDIEGRVENIRDLGGWKTVDGRRVKQGLVFRGQGLNDNSATGAAKGRNRLTVEDRDYLAETLGIKTDLDLRSGRETADMKESPLGDGIKFVHHSSEHYQRIFKKAGKKTMAKNFRVFTDAKNYPVYFHCIAGADRTGALAYTLLGVLGVSADDASIDWEHTFYPDLPEACGNYKKSYWRRVQHLENGFAKYGNGSSSFKERCELYLLDCGITKEEIERFRSIMLETPAEAGK